MCASTSTGRDSPIASASRSARGGAGRSITRAQRPLPSSTRGARGPRRSAYRASGRELWQRATGAGLRAAGAAPSGDSVHVRADQPPRAPGSRALRAPPRPRRAPSADERCPPYRGPVGRLHGRSRLPRHRSLIPVGVVERDPQAVAPHPDHRRRRDPGGDRAQPVRAPAQSSFTLLYAGLVVWLAIWRPPHALAFGSLALGALAIAQAALTFHGTGTVLYRGGGQDWLTYESQAQHIFATGSLQGGEDVFYWQPGFRYVLVTIRTLLGDGDLLVSALAQTLCNVAVLGLGLSLGRTTPARSLRWIPMALGLVLAVALINAPDILA